MKIWFQNRRTKWKKQENISESQVAEIRSAAGKKPAVPTALAPHHHHPSPPKAAPSCYLGASDLGGGLQSKGGYGFVSETAGPRFSDRMMCSTGGAEEYSTGGVMNLSTNSNLGNGGVSMTAANISTPLSAIVSLTQQAAPLGSDISTVKSTKPCKPASAQLVTSSSVSKIDTKQVDHVVPVIGSQNKDTEVPVNKLNSSVNCRTTSFNSKIRASTDDVGIASVDEHSPNKSTCSDEKPVYRLDSLSKSPSPYSHEVSNELKENDVLDNGANGMAVESTDMIR